MQRLDKQIAFINEIEKLKAIKRQNLTSDGNRPENSAEHSWQVALMALYLKEYAEQDIDISKVVKMLLVHDLGEIYAGDTLLYDDAKKAVAVKMEKEGISRLSSILPEDQANETILLWEEFEANETAEAQFATAIDAISPLLNHLHVSPDNYNPNSLSRNKVIEKKSFIKQVTPRLWDMVSDTIEKSTKKGLYSR